MKADILQSDEERVEIWERLCLTTMPDDYFMYMEASSQAQLKKLVEWLKQHNNCAVISEGRALTLTRKDWVSLQKLSTSPK